MPPIKYFDASGPLQQSLRTDYHSAIVRFFPENFHHGPRQPSPECIPRYVVGFRRLILNLGGHGGNRPSQAGAAIEGGKGGAGGRNHPNSPARGSSRRRPAD